MRTKFLSSLALAGVASLTLCTSNAHAQNVLNNNETPGSLLVYPLFDNTRGALTLFTVTNTSATTPIVAHFVYVNANNLCQETDRPHYLTPNDTITVNARVDNPNATKGYLFVFAKTAIPPSSEGPNAVKFDHLIGREWVWDAAQGDLLEFNPFTYKAGAAVTAEGGNTDVNPVNGKRDLNGQEYNLSPDVLEFPRFFAQVPGTRLSELVLLNLTGGAQFTAQADILGYGNNEDQFSASVTFTCWTRIPLTTTGVPTGVSAMFDNQFLFITANQTELAQTGIVCGWFTVDGVTANSTQTQLSNPAVLGVLIDSLAGLTLRTTTLPYGEGTNPNGRLLSHSLMGD